MAQLAARRSHNPKVASSILAGSIYIFMLFVLFLFGKLKNNKNFLKNKNSKFPVRELNPGLAGESRLS